MKPSKRINLIEEKLIEFMTGKDSENYDAAKHLLYRIQAIIQYLDETSEEESGK